MVDLPGRPGRVTFFYALKELVGSFYPYKGSEMEKTLPRYWRYICLRLIPKVSYSLALLCFSTLTLANHVKGEPLIYSLEIEKNTLAAANDTALATEGMKTEVMVGEGMTEEELKAWIEKVERGQIKLDLVGKDWLTHIYGDADIILKFDVDSYAAAFRTKLANKYLYAFCRAIQNKIRKGNNIRHDGQMSQAAGAQDVQNGRLSYLSKIKSIFISWIEKMIYGCVYVFDLLGKYSADKKKLNESLEGAKAALSYAQQHLVEKGLFPLTLEQDAKPFYDSSDNKITPSRNLRVQERMGLIRDQIETLWQSDRQEEAKAYIKKMIDHKMKLWEYGVYDFSFDLFTLGVFKSGPFQGEVGSFSASEMYLDKEKAREHMRDQLWKGIKATKDGLDEVAPELGGLYQSLADENYTIKKLESRWQLAFQESHEPEVATRALGLSGMSSKGFSFTAGSATNPNGRQKGTNHGRISAATEWPVNTSA